MRYIYKNSIFITGIVCDILCVKYFKNIYEYVKGYQSKMFHANPIDNRIALQPYRMNKFIFIIKWRHLFLLFTNLRLQGAKPMNCQNGTQYFVLFSLITDDSDDPSIGWLLYGYFTCKET